MAKSTSDRIELKLHEAVPLVVENSIRLAKENKKGVFYIIGPPGGGKTQMIEHYVKNKGVTENKTESDYGFIACTPALERVEKFGGIPDLSENEERELITRWSVPQIIEEARQLAKEKEHVIVLFDDWHLCPSNIQQIGFELFTHQSLNGHKVPNNVSFVLAGNEKSAAGAKIQLSAIRNRALTVYVKSDVDHWIENYAIPNNIHPACLGFFSVRENHSVFHEEEQTAHQFASPRSWTNLFDNLSCLEMMPGFNMDDNHHILRALFQGAVGPTAGLKFDEYYTFYSKIPVNKIYETGKFSIPDKAIERYAFTYAISVAFYDKLLDTHIQYSKKKDKAVEALMQKYKTTYAKIIEEMTVINKELVVKSMFYIGSKKENQQHKMPKGLDIITNMMSEGHLSMDVIRSLSKSSDFLRKFVASTEA
jgi:hypothetical protein